METIDSNQSTGSLTTPYSPSYIKSPFKVWKWMLIIALTCGVLGAFSLIYMEFIYYPAHRGNINWGDYESFQIIAVFLFVIGSLALTTASIMQLVLLYRNWKVIAKAEGLATDPAQAVGFLFIPLFNLYWQFIAHWKLSVGQEMFLQQAAITSAKTPNKGVAMAFCVCSCIPYINVLAALILGPIKEVNQKNVSLEIIRAVGVN
jgi:hypothetical protein